MAASLRSKIASPSPQRLAIMEWRIHAVGMVLECLLLANNGLSGHVGEETKVRASIDVFTFRRRLGGTRSQFTMKHASNRLYFRKTGH